MTSLSHIPVMLQEMVEALQPKEGETYIDATFGGGGYAKSILAKASCHVIGIDRDSEAIKRAQILAAEDPRFSYAHARFSEIPQVLLEKGITKVDGIVLDLGISSYQIDDGERGFSFRFNAPLSMEMGRNEISAYDVVNSFSEEEIADILYAGEERFARRIARAIVKARALSTLETTLDLASLISRTIPKPKDAQHPATLAFQALRIFVNEELIELQKILSFCKNILNPGGRLVVVTFHSLEDRIVKDFMRKESGYHPRPSRHYPDDSPTHKPLFALLHKRPLLPTEKECRENPRARSAKLRFAIRTDEPWMENR